MKNYKQLTAADRKAIEILLKDKYKVKEIANKLGYDKGTIYREIRKRETPAGYISWVAQVDYEKKRKRCKQKKKLDDRKLGNYVISKIKDGWSPDQIAGRIKLDGIYETVSIETIYTYIYTDSVCVRESIYQYLRFGRKKRRKWQGRKTQRSKIPNRVSIHTRPGEVATREKFGHWEGDSVLYANKKAINTLNELKTGLVEFTKLDRKTAELTSIAMIEKLRKYKARTLTLDNGSEFTNHEEITARTGVSVYFCDPYSSWQRGSNENSNGLLRGYLPRRYNIDNLTDEDLNDIASELNNRPRKRLAYKTPLEVYSEVLNFNDSVALHSRI